MSDTYDGNPANYPTSLAMATGGDQRNIGSIRVTLEGLADRTAFLHAGLGVPASTIVPISDPTDPVVVIEQLGTPNPELVTAVVDFTDLPVDTVVLFYAKLNIAGNALNLLSRLQFQVVEDVGGTPVTTDINDSCVWYESSASAIPRNEVVLIGSYTITTAGPFRVQIEHTGLAGNGVAGAWDTAADRTIIYEPLAIHAVAYQKGA